MPSDSEQLLRRVILGSLASLTAGHSASSSASPVAMTPMHAAVHVSETAGASRGKLTPKLILKHVSDTGSWSFAQHRSHSSHSSHRSHSSHSSHVSGSGGSALPRPAAPSPSYGSPASSNGSSSRGSSAGSSGSYSEPAAGTQGAQYTLGSRVLRKGMRGSDVNELMMVLVKDGYLKASHVNKDAYFSDKVELAVKAYQRAKKAPVDGVVGPVEAMWLREDEEK